ncbi:MAG: hypothetical protein NZ528_12115 [Caldilineales bacterium]|nr:hypothetical protein [Caldilineales bacterium]MDW8316947.1 hypothetical protein [Anaerolineae bacterium]
MALVGILLKATYRLRRHLWGGLSFDRWLALALVLVAVAMALRLLPGGPTGALVCLAAVGFLLLFDRWASGRSYVLFRRRPLPIDPDGDHAMLSPADKVAVRATGIFEVGEKVQPFTDLEGYFRSFQTREHAVMAKVPPSRLLMAEWPREDYGMWYIFFKNKELRRIEAGDLYFGAHRRPALRLRVEQTLPYKPSPLEAWGVPPKERPKPKVRKQTVHLAFDSAEERNRVLANLLADAGSVNGER